MEKPTLQTIEKCSALNCRNITSSIFHNFLQKKPPRFPKTILAFHNLAENENVIPYSSEISDLIKTIQELTLELLEYLPELSFLVSSHSLHLAVQPQPGIANPVRTAEPICPNIFLGHFMTPPINYGRS